MEYRNFHELLTQATVSSRKRVVLAGASDPHALETVLEAQKKKLVDYILVGERHAILKQADELGYAVDGKQIVEAASDQEAAAAAVSMIRRGEGDFLMKGKMQTGTLLKEVVNKETGIGTGRLMSHMCILQIPGYHKLVGFSDGGMLLHPDLRQKQELLKNGLRLFRRFAYACPKVAVLAAAETVNPKLQESLDAAELKRMAEEGAFGSCILEGPLSFDLAFSREAARTKGFESQVAGDVDLVIVPDITSGNCMTKAMILFAGAKMAGCVLGARVPIALNSRGASAEEKMDSLLLCAALA